MKKPVTLSLFIKFLALAAFVISLIVAENWFPNNNIGLWTEWVSGGLALYVLSDLVV